MKILIFVLFYVVPFLVTARKEHSNMKNLTKTQKLTISALCMALYLVVMMCTQSFAFGQYQVRIATALYGLSAIFPFLIIPFGLVNVLANTLMGGLCSLCILWRVYFVMYRFRLLSFRLFLSIADLCIVNFRDFILSVVILLIYLYPVH